MIKITEMTFEDFEKIYALATESIRVLKNKEEVKELIVNKLVKKYLNQDMQSFVGNENFIDTICELICKEYVLDSVSFIKVEDMTKALEVERCSLCTACWNSKKTM